VDPGSRICGYGLVDVAAGGTLRYVECGVLKARAGAELAERLADIAHDLGELIAEFAPAAVAVEDVFFAKSARSAFALAQARGAVLATAGMADVRVYSYAPALVKKLITGQGRAGKEQVARMVQVLLGLQRVPPADAADALAVAISHARVHAPVGAKRAGS
jgi:crossover junction endodeoxyribonuclease RuvC